MTVENPFTLRRRVALAFVAGLALLATLMPSVAQGYALDGQRYIVVFKGGYALNGDYALGQGYALVHQDQTYALESTYALERNYALYALKKTYALLDQYALTDEYALADDYALFGQYALESGYALAEDYALGQGYALADATAGYALDGSYALLDSTAGNYLGDNYALLDAYALGENYALARDYALYALSVAGGTITTDLSRQIGVFIVDSKNTHFAQIMKSYALVQYVGKDFGVDMWPNEQITVWNSADDPAEVPAGEDPLEPAQWDMQLIRTQAAHARATGDHVDVGVLDSGIDGNHNDFRDNGLPSGNSNVDCVRGADFTFEGPGVGNPLACVDNNFHGTHVAGTIGAQRNGIGVVGVAPDATLVPIKVCDGDGHCYVSDAVEGITYAGDIHVDVVNMSFFVDDDAFQESTEFKCQSNDTQRAYRTAVERALAYARGEGVSLVAALGNDDINLASDAARGGKKCKSVPTMSPGVIGTVALGPQSEKAWYSTWGSGWADVSAPGGNEEAVDGNCLTEILSTLPGNSYGCIQGTSMASPHATGMAALIISRFGKNDGSGGLKWAPDKVWSKMRATVVDIGTKGYDKCYGYGRIDALRVVNNDTSYKRDLSQVGCTEY